MNTLLIKTSYFFFIEFEMCVLCQSNEAESFMDHQINVLNFLFLYRTKSV